jgi:hypothetical protein
MNNPFILHPKNLAAALALFFLIQQSASQSLPENDTNTTTLTTSDPSSALNFTAMTLTLVSLGLLAGLGVSYWQSELKQHNLRLLLEGDNPFYALVQQLNLRFSDENNAKQFRQSMILLKMVCEDLYADDAALNHQLRQNIASALVINFQTYGLSSACGWGAKTHSFLNPLSIAACAQLASGCASEGAQIKTNSVIHSVFSSNPKTLTPTQMKAFIKVFFNDFSDDTDPSLAAPWETIIEAIAEKHDRFQCLISHLENISLSPHRSNPENLLKKLATAFSEAEGTITNNTFEKVVSDWAGSIKPKSVVSSFTSTAQVHPQSPRGNQASTNALETPTAS